MYQNIMIPLDGSDLAECVLPHVDAIIKNGLVKTASFITVLEPLPITLYDASVDTPLTIGHEDVFAPNVQFWEQKEEERKYSATEYLSKATGRFEQYKIEIKCVVLVGRVAETLANYADDNNINLILIATHGRSGIGRWLMGSVADRVLHSSHAPVMMIRAESCQTSEGT